MEGRVKNYQIIIYLWCFSQCSTTPIFHYSVQKFMTFFTAITIRLGLGR